MILLWLLGTASLAVALVFAALAIHEVLISRDVDGDQLDPSRDRGRGNAPPLRSPSRISDHRPAA